MKSHKFSTMPAEDQLSLKDSEDMSEEKFHSGFEERANTIPLEYILKCAEKEDCKTIVTCGHSLGGVVSSIVALGLMRSRERTDDLHVYNITFGAPFFGNETVRQMCKNYKLEQNILLYVDYKDIVPGLLSLDNTTNILKSRALQVTGMVNCLMFNV